MKQSSLRSLEYDDPSILITDVEKMENVVVFLISVNLFHTSRFSDLSALWEMQIDG